MIIRKLCMRQSRQLIALSRRAPISSRFQSTLPETPVEALQTPIRDEISRSENPLFEMVQAQSEANTPAQQEFTSNEPPSEPRIPSRRSLQRIN
ncbi:hypothetical protein N7530_001678 [Penicillium desertorum]|uniref:Uncharacterized protein n=1 Tax=Penicillium desertorum TaxID=1303715 RepID=A0A9X0BWJ0_9EURO|nr:hypothetical protein N7530_001678 [Penicillium desertorum]